MKIQESGENYLETILILKNRNGYVRSVDVANELSFTKASVSRAMSILRKAGLIVMEKNVIHMLHYYHPDETADEQVKELIGWGYDEQRPGRCRGSSDWHRCFWRVTVRVLNSYENLRLQQ